MLKHNKLNFLVTGSSSGIGRAIANELCRCGVNVIYHSKTKHDDIPSGRLYLVGDLSNEHEANRIASSIENNGCALDGIVCCAGRTHLSNIEDRCLLVGKQDCLQVLDNILFTTILICQKLVPAMIARGGGKIILIGGDVVGKPNDRGEMCSYAFSKAAVHEYGMYLARQLRSHNIAVNVVAPTGVTRVGKEGLSRKASEEEVANVVSFLCTKKNFISGEVIRINGARLSY